MTDAHLASTLGYELFSSLLFFFFFLSDNRDAINRETGRRRIGKTTRMFSRFDLRKRDLHTRNKLCARRRFIVGRRMPLIGQLPCDQACSVATLLSIYFFLFSNILFISITRSFPQFQERVLKLRALVSSPTISVPPFTETNSGRIYRSIRSTRAGCLDRENFSRVNSRAAGPS